jgi:dipeptide transport system substrate-binding protein
VAAPPLSRAWPPAGTFPDGLTYTFHLREGVKFHTTPYFKPTREFNADDVLFTFNRMINKDDPFRKAYPTEFPYFTDMGMDTNITKIDKVDDHTVKFTLKEVDAAFIQNMAMSFASIQSAEYAAQLLKEGRPPTSTRSRSAPARSCSRATRKTRTSVTPATRTTGTRGREDRQPDLRHHHRPVGAHPEAEEERMPGHPVPASGRPRGAQGRQDPEDADQAGFNLGYIAYNVMDKVKGSNEPTRWPTCACARRWTWR